MKILILDTETTGLDPKKDRVIEIGCVVWNADIGTTMSCRSELIYGLDNAAVDINCIPPAAIQQGMHEASALAIVGMYANNVDAIVAHNAEFDRSFLPDLKRPWICSKNDLEWPKSKTGASLVVTALAHGVGVTHAHRALTDCLILSRLFDRLYEDKYDVNAMLRHGLRPKAKFQAMVSYDDHNKAKKAGFAWDPERKLWTRTMAIEDAGKLEFQVRQL